MRPTAVVAYRGGDAATIHQNTPRSGPATVFRVISVFFYFVVVLGLTLRWAV